MTVHNKVALVTGAGQGSGRGIALRLAQDGFGPDSDYVTGQVLLVDGGMLYN